jgi:hypothetical protein
MPIDITHHETLSTLSAAADPHDRLCVVKTEWWVNDGDEEVRMDLYVDFHTATILHHASVERLQLVYAAAICEAFEVDDIRTEPGRITGVRLGVPGAVHETDLHAEAVFPEGPIEFFKGLEERLEKLRAYVERKIDVP